jgi:hypothetical protein
MKRKLRVTENGRSRELLLVGTMAVGRDPECDISGSDPLLSRRHAEIEALSDSVLVRDLQSRNGITVNGRKVDEVELRPGDRVQVAGLRIEYVVGPDSAADEATIKTLPEPPLRRSTIEPLAVPAAAGRFTPSEDDRRPADPPDVNDDDDKTRVVPRTEDLSLKLRSVTAMRLAAPVQARSAPELPRAWTTRVRAAVLGLALLVWLACAVLLTVGQSALPFALAVAAVIAAAAAGAAAFAIEQFTIARLPALQRSDRDEGTSPPSEGAGRRDNDADLPLQQWPPPVDRSTGRQTVVLRSSR